MTTFENIADVLVIKEHIDHALSNSYEGLSYDRNFNALGQEIMIYTRDGQYENEVILTSDKLDSIYVLNNHIGYQTEIIQELLKK